MVANYVGSYAILVGDEAGIEQELCSLYVQASSETPVLQESVRACDRHVSSVSCRLLLLFGSSLWGCSRRLVLRSSGATSSHFWTILLLFPVAPFPIIL